MKKLMKKIDLINFLTFITSDIKDIPETIDKIKNFLKTGKCPNINLTTKDLLNLKEAIEKKSMQKDLQYISAQPLPKEQDQIFSEFHNMFHFEMNDKEKQLVRDKFGTISEILSVYSKKFEYSEYMAASFFNVIYRYAEDQLFRHQMSNIAKGLPEDLSSLTIEEITKAKEKLEEGMKNLERRGTTQKSGSVKNSQDTERKLRQFAAAGNFTEVEQLLKQKTNPNAKGVNSGNAALHEVIIYLANGTGKLEDALKVIELLCKTKADINICDKKNNTPFILAAKLLLPKEKRIPVLKKLQELGAKTELKNHDGKTGIDYHQQALKMEKSQETSESKLNFK